MHIWEIFAHFTKNHITSSLFVVKYYQVNGNLPKKTGGSDMADIYANMGKNLIGTKTFDNLMEAFAGESDCQDL